MKYNSDKCRVIHLRRNNQPYECKIGDNWLNGNTIEKDIGVLVDNKFNKSLQCDDAAVLDASIEALAARHRS